MKKIIYTHLPDILASILILLFTIAGSIISLHQYWQYSVFYYDFGIFDQAIWKVAHFQPPIIEHFVHEGQWIFADHFNPTIFLLAPLYWITNHSEIILIAQAILFGVGCGLLYYSGKVITNNNWFSLTILVCYALFVGLQNAVIADFHEVSLTIIFFLLTYLFFEKKQIFWFWLSFLLMLGTKESNYALGIALGISLILLQKNRWKQGLATSVIAGIYGTIIIKMVIPFFSPTGYQYAVTLSYNPINYITSLTNDPLKIKTIFFSFASFGFLPILSPAFYLLILEDFIARFYPPFLTISWSLGLHYSAVTSAIMGLSSLYSFNLVKKLTRYQKILYIICILLVCNALILYRFILRTPFALAYNKAFYQHTKDFRFLDALIAAVPKTSGSIMTQNNLAVRFTHENVYLFRDKCKKCLEYSYVAMKPTYIVLDAREGQNPNDYYGSGPINKIVNTVLSDKNYRVIYHHGDQYVFVRR